MTASVYFRLWDERSTSNRWYLSEVCDPCGEFLGRALTTGKRFEGGGPLTTVIYRPGPELELTFSADLVPIVNQRVADLLQRRAADDIQLLPIEVAGSSERLLAVNILAMPDCVDENRSEEVERFTAEDGRPDRIGEYKGIGLLRIDPARAAGHHIFRPRGWGVVIAVSELLAKDLQANRVRCELRPIS